MTPEEWQAMRARCKAEDVPRLLGVLEAAEREIERLRGRPCPASATSDPPQDCDMPFCSCNPAWHDALAAAQESGWLTSSEATELRAKVAAAEARERTLVDAIRWALGEINEFSPRESGQGAFWWRPELRRRAGLDTPEASASATSTEARP